MLDTKDLSEVQLFPQDAAFKQEAPLPQIISAVRFLLDEMIPNSWIGRYNLASWPAK